MIPEYQLANEPQKADLLLLRREGLPRRAEGAPARAADELLAALSPEFVATLPEHVQQEIRRRVRH
ncbi:MAG: hypothetical protein HYV07_06875 [Deltaproteobacteria bacterium]|nr:hypothetical protein [Deltaproteobacteria bacterium]